MNYHQISSNTHLISSPVDSEDSDETGWMPRLIQVFMECKARVIGFVMKWLIYSVTAVVKYVIFELRHEKTNILVSDQFLHKPGCTATEEC